MNQPQLGGQNNEHSSHTGPKSGNGGAKLLPYIAFKHDYGSYLSSSFHISTRTFSPIKPFFTTSWSCLESAAI